MPFNEDAEYWLRVAAVAPLHHQAVALVRKREWYGSLGSAKYALENLACKREITRRMLRRVPALAEAAARGRRGSRTRRRSTFLNGGRPAGGRHLRRASRSTPPSRRRALRSSCPTCPPTRPPPCARLAHSWSATPRRDDADAPATTPQTAPDQRDRPLRVVHVMTSVLSGGAEENTLATCRGQIARGYEVWLIHGRSNGSSDAGTGAPRCGSCASRGCTGRSPAGGPRSARARSPDHPGDRAGCRAYPPVEGGDHRARGGPACAGAGHPAQRAHLAVSQRPLRRGGCSISGSNGGVSPVTDAYISVAKGMRDANLAAGLGTPERNFVVYSGMPPGEVPQGRPPPDAPSGPMIACVAALEPRKRHAACSMSSRGLRGATRRCSLYLFGKGPGGGAEGRGSRRSGLAGGCISWASPRCGALDRGRRPLRPVLDARGSAAGRRAIRRRRQAGRGHPSGRDRRNRRGRRERLRRGRDDFDGHGPRDRPAPTRPGPAPEDGGGGADAGPVALVGGADGTRLDRDPARMYWHERPPTVRAMS
jgi:hypothetical protein